MDNRSIIRHGAFGNLITVNEDIFIKYFGKNIKGQNLLKFGTLLNRINIISERVIRDYWELYPDDPQNVGTGLDRLKGDVFEIFIEGMIKALGAAPTIGISNYRPERREADWGVDGYGLGTDNKSLTVQVKFRSNPNTTLYERDIKQFAFQSYIAYGVDIHTSNNLVLISSCQGLHPITKSQVFLSKIREINGEQLKNLIDDNNAFWNNFNQIINNTIKVMFGTKKLGKINAIESDIDDEQATEVPTY